MNFLSGSLLLYAASLATALGVAARRGMPLFSNFSVYFAFSLLYVASPLVNHLLPTFLSEWSPAYANGVMERYILVSALCNFSFLAVYTRSRDRSFSKPAFLSYPGKDLAFPVLAVMTGLGVVVVLLGAKYPYGHPRPEMVHSLISNLTVLASGTFMLCMFTVRGWKLAAAFLVMTACMMVEHSRWAFISAFLALAFYLDDQGRLSLRVKIFSLLAVSVLLSSVALFRVGRFEWGVLAEPFFVEGVMGSYPALQSMALVSKGFSSFSYFADYVVDPVVYMVPRAVFHALDLQKDAIGILPSLLSRAQPLLDLPFAPRGGFHYIAQANMALPYFGPVAVAALLAKLTAYIENKRASSPLMFVLYYLYSAGFFFVFLKTIFALTIKYFVTLSAPTGIFALLTARKARFRLGTVEP
jgi:hypothetical protein